MVPCRPEQGISLPKGWPRRVRSAVIHAISKARFALAVGCGEAAKTLEACVLLKHDIDRLLREPRSS